MNTEQQNQILSCMAEVLGQNQLPAELIQNENAPTLLRCTVKKQGKSERDVLLELCFIPMQFPGDDMGLLQCFATLFDGAEENRDDQLHRACAYCNNFCALGAFGYFEQAGQVYLKHGCLLDGSLGLDQHIALLANYVSLLLASVARFIDGLAGVAFDGLTVEDAIQKELFPQLLA